MASLSYIDYDDPYNRGSFGQHPIFDIVFLCLEKADATDGLRKVERLTKLLMLSNHMDKACVLIRALIEHHEAIQHHEWHMPSWPFEEVLKAHPLQPNPRKGFDEPEGVNMTSDQREKLELSQWHQYRECTRTGWMLEHCDLPEPEDRHIWRETDDAPTIAMCARLLAKCTTPGKYPTEENMREVLDAAKKLYAQPQVPITEYKLERTGKQIPRRHSYLLYRRLVIQLAIKVGELETAAEVLSLGLRLDGFNFSDGGSLDHYLRVPGIYDVLPLLAVRGEEGNPYFIDADIADRMVLEVSAALKLRAQKGRQWSLSPGKVGWKALLGRLAKAAWAVNHKEYETSGITCAEDILYPPATKEEIAQAEAEVGELPSDFKEMIRVANGFRGGWHFLNGGVKGVRDIEFLYGDFDTICLDILGHLREGLENKVIALSPAQECDGFTHYMISPANWRNPDSGEIFQNGEYPYWTSAPWQAADYFWHSIRDWVACEVERLETELRQK